MNNISINNSHSWKASIPHDDRSTQTESSGDVCHCNYANEGQVSNHSKSSHTQNKSSSQSPKSNQAHLPSNDLLECEASENVLTCTICGRTFDSSLLLDRHIETNHNESSRNFHCQQSGTTDETEIELVEPVKESCDKCSLSFTSLEHLREHKETLHVAEPLNCKLCAYMCKSKSHLNYHVAACHKDDSTKSPVLGPSSPLSPPSLPPDQVLPIAEDPTSSQDQSL